MPAEHWISHQLTQQKILYPPVNSQSRTCNCINKTNCPLQEKYLSKNTLYQAYISSENLKKKIFYGISETKLKTRYSNHKKSFNHEKYKNDTQLSDELWKTKVSKEEQVSVWKILGQYQPDNVNTKQCLLCLNEKLQIATYWGNNMLNKRTEIISKFRHRNKYTLASYDSMGRNVRCKVEVLWIFLIFGARDNLIYCSYEADWEKFHLFQYILRTNIFHVTYIAHTFSPLFTWVLFMGVKRIFLHLVLWRRLKYETITLK